VRQRFLGPDSLFPPALGDLDRDSSLDAVVVSASGSLWAVDTAWADLSGFPVDLGFAPSAPPVLADVDRDGYLDIVAVGEGYLTAYAHNGALVTNFPIPLGRSNARDSGAVAPVIADLGGPDAMTLMSAGVRRIIHGYDGHGREAETFPKPLGRKSRAPIAWATNHINSVAAVFARASDGFLYAYELPYVMVPATATWPMAARDSRLTRMIPIDDLGPVDVDDDFFVAERAFVYPNPANDHAVVRYWLGDDAAVRIRIFDVAGNLVVDADGPGSGGLYNEWTWDCSRAASGVYFAHVEVVGLENAKKETVLCKMAVVQ
jgi:hypothetical protein